MLKIILLSVGNKVCQVHFCNMLSWNLINVAQNHEFPYTPHSSKAVITCWVNVADLTLCGTPFDEGSDVDSDCMQR